MIVTPSSYQYELPVDDGTRSKGLHLSDIYNDLYQDLEPKRYVRGSPLDEVRLEAGLTFEEVLEQGLARRVAGGRPGEYCKDGIYFTPDLLLVEDTPTSIGNATLLRVGEVKLTWLSSREMPTAVSNNLPPKFDKYLTQLKGYCYALETVYGRLYIYFVNGDYQHPYTPVLRAWDLQFSPRELELTWRMLMNHAKSKGMI